MYTVKEVAKITGRCEEQVRRWIRSGVLKADRRRKTDDSFNKGKGLAWLISEAELDRFLNRPLVSTTNMEEEEKRTKLILELAQIQTTIQQLRQRQNEIFSELKG